jgi:hypothetical protein
MVGYLALNSWIFNEKAIFYLFVMLWNTSYKITKWLGVDGNVQEGIIVCSWKAKWFELENYFIVAWQN